MPKARQLTLLEQPTTYASGAEWGPPGDRSSCWRTLLWRTWADGGRVAFIGLNPSTATEVDDDPTIRRCIRFAKDLNAGGLYMLNLFAWRDKEPKALLGVPDPIGSWTGPCPTNIQQIHRVALDPSVTMMIAAWGDSLPKKLAHWPETVTRMVTNAGRPLHALRTTQHRNPSHPLFLPANLKPFMWRSAMR